MPALVLIGEHDVSDFRDDRRRSSRRAIPGARLETITGAAHLPSMEQPEAVEELLVPFLLENA